MNHNQPQKEQQSTQLNPTSSNSSSSEIKLSTHLTNLSNKNKLKELPSLNKNKRVFKDELNDVKFVVNSRSQRKGIFPVLFLDPSSSPSTLSSGKTISVEFSVESQPQPQKVPWKLKRQPIKLISFDYWDITYWVSILFLVGSLFWCINGTMFYCYFSNTSSQFLETESATAFLGGTLFLIGVYLGYVESLNSTQDIYFGWEVDEVTRTLIEPNHHHTSSHSQPFGRNRHHFGNFNKTLTPHLSASSNSSPLNTSPTIPNSNSLNHDEKSTQHPPINPPSSSPKWRWFGTSNTLAYYANLIQLIGASIFWISTLCGLPGVLPLAGSSGGPEQEGKIEAIWLVFFWAPQVLAAPGFVVSGIMFCLEVQDRWWKPNVWTFGWQIGFWNALGGLGFFFCGLFGIWRQTSLSNPELYQRNGTALSTFWGSWAFLIGSYIQLYEGINKVA